MNKLSPWCWLFSVETWIAVLRFVRILDYSGYSEKLFQFQSCPQRRLNNWIIKWQEIVKFLVSVADQVERCMWSLMLKSALRYLCEAHSLSPWSDFMSDGCYDVIPSDTWHVTDFCLETWKDKIGSPKTRTLIILTHQLKYVLSAYWKFLTSNYKSFWT